MSIEYTTYLKATGEVLSSGIGPSNAATLYDTLTEGAVEGLGNPADHYVTGLTLTLRPAAAATMDVREILANGVAAATITGIPTGWTYSISNGATGTTDGSAVVFTAIEPAVYVIEFNKWPYLPARFVINATATY